MNSFEDWYDENLRALLKGNLRGGLLAAWEAAQEAERKKLPEEKDWLIERIRFLKQQIAERK
jgi:hypothetical protein